MTSSDDSPVPDYLSMLRLDQRRFLVIGAGNGIGRQASHALAMAGARLCCVDIVPELAREIAEEVGGTSAVGDMRTRTDAERVFAQASGDLGGLDGVVGIIGTSHWAPITELGDADWDAQHDLVIRYAFLAIQLGARAMAGSGGSMVFVASLSGLFAAPNHAAYGAAKAGMMALVKSAAEELGPAVRVNAVAPGRGQALPAGGSWPRTRAGGRWCRCASWPSRVTSPPPSCSCRPTSPATSPARRSWSTAGPESAAPSPPRVARLARAAAAAAPAAAPAAGPDPPPLGQAPRSPPSPSI